MIALIGEALVDMIEQPDGRYQACLGGSVFNVAIGLARQGMTAAYLNPLSMDKFGRLLRSRLRTENVTLSCQHPSEWPTSVAMVHLSTQGHPSYTFHRGRVADRDTDAARMIISLPMQFDVLHTGGLALLPDDMDVLEPVLHASRRRGAMISMDANMRPAAANDADSAAELAWQHLKQAHVVKLSGEDLDALGRGGLSDEEAARAVFAQGEAELVAITRGAEGAALFTRAASVSSGAPRQVRIADTVGAGDCFMAGLLAYLRKRGALAGTDVLRALDTGTLTAALRHAVCAAGSSLERPGCVPPTWQQTIAFDQSWK